MNQPAIDFYRDKGVDLYTQPLEIALCAQHNNGGLGIDCWWQTNVKSLFAVGEVAASHGVYRPGGTALNAGQVGSTRAAQYIAARCQGEAPDCFDTAAASALKEMSELANSCTAETGNVRTLWKQASAAMSRCGAAIRDEEQIREYCKVVQTQLKISHDREGFQSRRTRNGVSAARYASESTSLPDSDGGLQSTWWKKSGQCALHRQENGTKPFAHLPDTFTFALDKNEQPLIQELRYEMVFAKPTGESRALSRRMMISLKMYGEAIVKQEISNNILDID